MQPDARRLSENVQEKLSPIQGIGPCPWRRARRSDSLGMCPVSVVWRDIPISAPVGGMPLPRVRR